MRSTLDHSTTGATSHPPQEPGGNAEEQVAEDDGIEHGFALTSLGILVFQQKNVAGDLRDLTIHDNDVIIVIFVGDEQTVVAGGSHACSPRQAIAVNTRSVSLKKALWVS